MKSKLYVIVLCSIIVFAIVLFSYRTGLQKQVSPEYETVGELYAQRPDDESEKTESESSYLIEDLTEDLECVNTERADIRSEDAGSETDGGTDTDVTESERVKYDTDAFYYTELTDDIRRRITGKSYPDTGEPLQISYDDLAYVHVLYYDFDAQVQEGELICNQAIAQDLTEIFGGLYDNQYPIGKICLVDEYDADDEASMADNNTSCFNYRPVPGKTKLSNHSYGRAIDINPLYNPYIRTKNGETLISPDNAVPYADRSADFPHKIDKNDLCYKLFVQHGFSWGGAWNSSKDYQHFEKID